MDEMDQVFTDELATFLLDHPHILGQTVNEIAPGLYQCVACTYELRLSEA